MRRELSLLLTAALTATTVVTGSTAAAAIVPVSPSVFVNEIDYDAVGTDDAGTEYVEIAGPEGTDLSTFSIVLYNGSNGTEYGTTTLSGTIPAAGVVGVAYDSANSVQNGNPDGIALLDGGAVVQFLSYEGSFAATDGPANGMTSTDIGVADNNDDAISVQLTGNGSTYDDFTWTTAAPSRDAANAGQSFGAPGDPLADLVLNEIVVTPTGGEFIEIRNRGTQVVDLSDVYLTDATFAGGGVYYYNLPTGSDAGGGDFADFHARFPDGATIAGGELQVVALAGATAYATEYGVEADYELVDTDLAVPDMREATTGSINGQGGLTNSGEVVVLHHWDGVSDLVEDLDYVLWGDTAEAVDKTGVAIDGPDDGIETTTHLDDTAIVDQQIVQASAHASGKSYSRVDVTEGTETQSGGNGVAGADETSEDLATTWAVYDASPGTENVEVAPVDPCTVDPTLVSAVQGTGDDGSMEGADVTVRAAVTAHLSDLAGGILFVQEEAADSDGDPATSEGVAVAVGGIDVSALAVGDVVAVSGTVEEEFGMTRIAASDIATCDDPAEVVAPTPLVFPLDDADREALEGMHVTTADTTMTITNTYDAYRFGELGLSATGDVLYQPTEVFSPVDEAAAVEALSESNAENLLVVGDGGRSGGAQFQPEPWFDEGAMPRAGFTNVEPIAGPLYFTFGDHVLQYRDGEEPTFDGLRPGAPDVDGAERIATFNVLNLFNGDGAGGGFPAPRGARTFEEYQAQLDGIVEAILGLDAAVVGLMEIENDVDEGELSSIAQLVDALNAAAAPGEDDWAYITPTVGPAEPDEIAVGLIHRASLADPVGPAATFDIDAFLQETDDTGDKSRFPIAQTFDIDGELVTPVINHLKSKGSSCEEVSTTDDYTGPVPFEVGDDDGSTAAGNCDLTRTYAAHRLLEWLATDPTGVDTDAYVIGGDLNSYTEERPLDVLRDAGYVDLVDTLGDDAYSYQFGGRFGRLDQLFASSDAAPLFADADVWQINSPESIGFLYDNEDTDGVYASSDHDPVIAALAAEDVEPEPEPEPEPTDESTAEVTGDGTVTLTIGDVTITITFTGVEGSGTVSLALVEDAEHPRGISIADVVVELTADGFTFATASFTLPTDGVAGPASCFRLRGDEADDVTGTTDEADTTACEVTSFSVFAAGVHDVSRLAGDDRIGTAVAISQDSHPAGADRAYVARADVFADAVAAGPVAFADDAPILLTATDALPEATADELVRLGVTEIVVLGGEVAVSDDVVAALDEIATTTRIAGATRYETAALASAATFDDADVVHVATGEAFPDALTGGVAAARDGGPVLLVRTDEVPAAVADELERLSPDRIVVLGGTVAVSNATAGELLAYTSRIERIGGATRYDTARLVAATFDAPVDVAHVATGQAFPDALAGVPAAAAAGGPILLTTPDALSPKAEGALVSLDPDRVVVLGGPLAVTDEVVTATKATLIGAR